MEKLSERFMYYCGLLATVYRKNVNVDVLVNDIKHIQNLIDAEEQGLLLKLPCKVGDRTYQIVSEYTRRNKGCTCCTTACGSNANCEYFDKETEECLNYTLKERFQIISRGFRLEDYYDIGKTVFLTKEEAEQALKQMGE